MQQREELIGSHNVSYRLRAEKPERGNVHLLEDAMKNIRDLISHSFGKYVVAAILEHGSDKHKHVIANELRKDSTPPKHLYHPKENELPQRPCL
eukprot:6029932-Amphidinium_carterae.2